MAHGVCWGGGGKVEDMVGNTSQENRGIWMFIFPDRENTGNLPKIFKI